ncbi:secretion lowering protein [Scheffersomyces amazonensis]|uniref:secretion lowering protein n=1 Tax=Scheffersomyces amazonensis TaxID=1078765 RepID=UPI00315E022B
MSSRVSGLNEDQLQSFNTFKAITGLADKENNQEDDDNVITLLSINDFNVNNAINAFFESGFTSITERTRTPANTFSSSVDVHDQDQHDTTANHHRSNSSHQFMNLQSQLLAENLLPRLPKAPKISNGWQIEVGIQSSLLEQRREEESARRKEAESDRFSDTTTLNETVSDRETKQPFHSLWLILLIIPKTLLHLIVSAYKYLFGSPRLNSDKSLRNTVPKSFIYDDNFDPTYKFLPWYERALGKLPFSSQDEKIDNIEDTSNDDISTLVESKTDTESSEQDIKSTIDSFDDYNIEYTDYNAVHERCQKNYLWLFVILINSSPESTQFVKSLLSPQKDSNNDDDNNNNNSNNNNTKNNGFHLLFNKISGQFKDTILYINNIDKSPEAFEIASTYKVRRTPFVMLVGNVTPSPSIMSSMSIVYKSNLMAEFLETPAETTTTVKRVYRNVAKVVDRFHPQLVAARFDQQEIELSRLLKQQQDDAYLQSLQQDKIKKEKRQQEEKLAKTKELKEKLRVKFLLSLLSSKFVSSITESTLPNSSTRVAIKLPSGQRLVQSFNKDTRVNQVYLYIDLVLFSDKHAVNIKDDHEEVIDKIATNLKVDTIPDGQIPTEEEFFESYSFKFELIQPFPKKVVVCSNSTLSEMDEFRSGANFLVEYNEDDEDDEDDGLEQEDYDEYTTDES